MLRRTLAKAAAIVVIGAAVSTLAHPAGAQTTDTTTTTSTTTTSTTTSTSTTTTSSTTTSTTTSAAPTTTTTTTAPTTIAPTTTVAPAPTTSAAPGPTTTAQACDPNYPALCLPVYAGVDNIDCDSPEVGGLDNFLVGPNDPYGLDGDRDGAGCEDPAGGARVEGASVTRGDGSATDGRGLAATGIPAVLLATVGLFLCASGQGFRHRAAELLFRRRDTTVPHDERRRALNQRHRYW